MLFRPASDSTIELASAPESPSAVPWDFEDVTAMRWCDERGELLVTGTPPGAAIPSALGGERGDRRLFAWSEPAGWREVGPRAYADDPVATADAYAVSRGAGIRVVEADGGVRHELKRGRFSWGPPSLSLNPAETRLAWNRWQGDNQKPCVLDLETFEATEFTPSLFRYAWLDDDTILYVLGSTPKALDVRTGRSSQFAKERWGEIQTIGGDIWFTDDLRQRLFRKTGETTEEVWTAARSLRARLGGTASERIEWLLPQPDGSVWLRLEIYRGLTIVRREERWLGPLADRASGWAPLPGCSQPTFGFVF